MNVGFKLKNFYQQLLITIHQQITKDSKDEQTQYLLASYTG